MTEKTEKTFEPITSQEEFDERIKARLAREREKWEKESGVEDLQRQIAEKDKELQDVRADHHREAAERAVREHLQSIGVVDEGRQSRILKYVDLGEVSLDDASTIMQSLVSVQKDLPELFEGHRLGGSGSRGSEKPVLDPEKPLTREEIEAMDPEEQRKPGMKERIDAFLAGQR
jgi:hypothetical protein